MKKGRRAQLDRENAHFILSEAMISTFEQVTSITDAPLSGSIGIHNAKMIIIHEWLLIGVTGYILPLQMNFERKMQELEEEGGAESDEEIRELKRRFLSFNDNDYLNICIYMI